MSVLFVRRRKLGRTSCREIVARMNQQAAVWRNDLRAPNGGEAELYVRWGCTANVAGTNVLNKASAIHQVNDKLNFRLLCAENEVSPYTVTSLEDEADIYPAVVRPARHSRGRNLWVVHSHAELRNLVQTRLQGQQWYASLKIEKVAEYRVCIVSGRVAWVAKKTPGNPDDVAWNVARGGRFDNVRFGEWPLKGVKTAIAAFNLTELDFGGVDIMVDAENNWYVLEINSAPSITSDYRQTCMAKCFDYIVANGKDRIDLIAERGGWRKFIHPAISEEAQMV